MQKIRQAAIQKLGLQKFWFFKAALKASGPSSPSLELFKSHRLGQLVFGLARTQASTRHPRLNRSKDGTAEALGAGVRPCTVVRANLTLLLR